MGLTLRRRPFFLHILLLFVLLAPVLSAQPVRSGEVVITEFLAHPSEKVGTEFIELYNPGEATVDLSGYILHDEQDDFHRISPDEPLLIPSKAFLLLSRTKSLPGIDTLNVAYVYNAFILNNLDDEIILTDPEGSVVTAVRYRLDQQAEEDRSMELRWLPDASYIDSLTASHYRPASGSSYLPGLTGSPLEPGRTLLATIPQLTFLDPSVRVDEEDGGVELKLQLNNRVTTESRVVLEFDTTASTATVTDLKLGQLEITLEPGMVAGEMVSIELGIIDDRQFEQDEVAQFFINSVSVAGRSLPLPKPDTVRMVIVSDDLPVVAINELNVGAETGADWNRDGSYTVADRYIELWNREPLPIDLTGWQLNTDRGTYSLPDSSTIAANQSLLLVHPSPTIPDADSLNGMAWESLAQIVPERQLSLTNADRALIDRAVLPKSDSFAGAMVRYPEGFGALIPHKKAPGARSALTPGLRVDRTPFSAGSLLMLNAGRYPATQLLESLLATQYSEKELLSVTPQAARDSLNGAEDSFQYSQQPTWLLLGDTLRLPLSQELIRRTERITIPGNPQSESDRWFFHTNTTRSYVDLRALRADQASVKSEMLVWNVAEKRFEPAIATDHLLPPFGIVAFYGAPGSSIEWPDEAFLEPESLPIIREPYYTIALRLAPSSAASDVGQHFTPSFIYLHPEAESGSDTYDLPLIPLPDGGDTPVSFLLPEADTLGAHLVDARPIETEEPQQIRLALNLCQTGAEPELMWKLSSAIPTRWSLLLNDRETGAIIDMRNTTSYPIMFSEEICDDPSKADAIDSRWVITVDQSNEPAETEGDQELVTDAKLHPNYPNPFNPTTTISFTLPEPARVKLSVYNVVGQQITVLSEGVAEKGDHQFIWDASQYPSGIYIYQLEVGREVITRKMTLIK